jgi:hypothetical protein
MKKFYLFCTLALISYLSHAQISKGTILLGGNLELNTGTDKAVTAAGTQIGSKTSTTGITVYPSVGWAVKDNLVLGIQPGIGYYSSSNGAGNYDSKENDYSLGFFLRKYKPLGNHFYFFGESMLSFAYQLPTDDNPGSPVIHQDGKVIDLSLGFSPGAAYALSRKWLLEMEFPNVLNVWYSHSKTNMVYSSAPPSPPTTSSTEITNQFNFSTSLTTNFQLEVGLRYLIGG